MSIKHHPDDATVAAYAAGSLPPALALVVTVHLEMCAQCSETQLLALETGGALFDAQAGLALPAHSLDLCWAAIQARAGAGEADAPASDTVAPRPATSALDKHLPVTLDKLAWQRLTPNVAQFVVPGLQHGRGWARLFRFQPGTIVPRHGHRGEEFSLVLQGAYTDQSGRFGIGDFAQADTSFGHQPAVADDAPCIALIAATDAPRFDGLLYRAASRLVGI